MPWTDIAQPDKVPWISQPAAVFTRAGRIELFCLGCDHEIYHRAYLFYEKRWDPEDMWSSLGGDFASAPTAISSRSGKVYVFCKGIDEEIYFRDLNDKEWKSLGYAG